MKIKLLCLLAAFATLPVSAQNYVQDFEDSSAVASQGWVMVNNSNPPGSTGWFEGNTSVFAAHSNSGYYAANYNNASGTGTISNWLISPDRWLMNGDSIIFYTRTTDSSQANVFPDRLQVRLSQNGTSTNVGTQATDLGDFTSLILEINPTYDTTGFPNGYPSHWRKYTIVLSGLPGSGVSGRFAFRYFVENGGPTGANSDYIGIDSCAFRSIVNGVADLQPIRFSVYPNPATDNIRLQFNDLYPGAAYSLSILDMNGRILRFEELSEIDNKALIINVMDLSPGIYLIRIRNEGHTGSHKLIIR